MGLSRNIARVIVSDTGEISASNLGAVPPTPEVLTPSNTSPANEATDVGETPTLTASTFYSLYGFTHAKSQWQVSTVSDFASTVVSTGDVDDLTSYTVAGGVLSTSTTYYWRVRYKDSNGSYSAWSTATTFTTLSDFAFNVDFLVVAGGGAGGGSWRAAGGGAGGYRTSAGTSGGGASAESPLSVFTNTNYTVTVGAGGSGVTNLTGDNGSPSVFSTVTSIGGGGGGGEWANNNPGLPGGSGGGGMGGNGTTTSGGNGTTNQGFNGEGGPNNVARGGGGGGAGEAGGTDGPSQGGDGVASSITGSSVIRAGGGGGGNYSDGTVRVGGEGGGGNGGLGESSPGGNGNPGTENTGSGGGGSSGPAPTSIGGGGGSGIVIIKYPDAKTISNPGGGLTYSTSTAGGFSVTTFIVGTGNVSWS